MQVTGEKTFALEWIWARGPLALAVGATILINLLGLALPLALLQVYDRIIPNQSASTITLLIFGVGVAILLEMLMRTGRAYVMAATAARYEHRAGIAALKHVLSSDVTAFEREGAGTLIERLNAIGIVREYYGGQAVAAILDLPFVLLFIGLVFYFGGELGLLLAGIVTLYGLSAISLGRRLSNAVIQSQDNDEHRINFIISALQGISTIKAQAMERLIQRWFEPHQYHATESSRYLAGQTGNLTDLGYFFGQFAILAVVGYGAILVVFGDLSVGGLAACTLLVGRAMQPVNGIVGFWTRFQSIRSARERFEKIFSIPLGPQVISDDNAGAAAEAQQSKGHIRARNVCFRFSDTDADVLSGIDLEILPGECIAVTGPNGSGKSTLLTLLRGFALPQEGEIFIDGKPISEWNAEAFDLAVSYLPQQEVLLNGTILENITTFRADKEQQAIEAADMVGLTAFVQGLPEGFHTSVGAAAAEPIPRGIGQRIALARALVNNPKILLFDDANSAVDQDGDVAIKAVLGSLKGHCTTVVVSHRPSILKMADRIYYVADGKLTLESQIDSATSIGGAGHE